MGQIQPTEPLYPARWATNRPPEVGDMAYYRIRCLLVPADHDHWWLTWLTAAASKLLLHTRTPSLRSLTAAAFRVLTTITTAVAMVAAFMTQAGFSSKKFCILIQSRALHEFDTPDLAQGDQMC